MTAYKEQTLLQRNLFLKENLSLNEVVINKIKLKFRWIHKFYISDNLKNLMHYIQLLESSFTAKFKKKSLKVFSKSMVGCRHKSEALNYTSYITRCQKLMWSINMQKWPTWPSILNSNFKNILLLVKRKNVS